MRVVMPLFGFHATGLSEFEFDSTLRIEPFDKLDVLEIDLFSANDLQSMRSAHWAVTFNSPKVDGHRSLINMLLLSFRAFSDRRPPFIKFRLCKDDLQYCSRLPQPMLYNKSNKNISKPYGLVGLRRVAAGFRHLREMDSISNRTHNAIYFFHRSLHTDKWVDSFLLMMSALEALFSNDTPTAATKAITRRVSSLLNERRRCTRSDIANLYAIRSDMSHGRIALADTPGKNLARLAHLEFVTSRCFREIVRSMGYREFASNAMREQYMKILDAGP